MSIEPTMPGLAELLAQRNFGAIKMQLSQLPPADSVEAMESLSAAEQAVLFRLLPTDKAADLFNKLLGGSK